MSVFCTLLFVGLSIGTERLYEFCGEIFLAYRSIGLSCQLLVFFASKELLLIIDPDSFGANVYCRKIQIGLLSYCRCQQTQCCNVLYSVSSGMLYSRSFSSRLLMLLAFTLVRWRHQTDGAQSPSRNTPNASFGGKPPAMRRFRAAASANYQLTDYPQVPDSLKFCPTYAGQTGSSQLGGFPKDEAPS